MRLINKTRRTGRGRMRWSSHKRRGPRVVRTKARGAYRFRFPRRRGRFRRLR